METDDSCSDHILNCAPPPIFGAAKEATLNLLPLLPAKSKKRYEFAYDQFMNWCKQKNVKSSFSENVLLAYFGELAGKMSPNTLWCLYSMLHSTLTIHQNVDIAQYVKLRAFLKRQSYGYKPKKPKTLTMEEINRFLNEAPDDEHLLQKVVLIVGISGSCRRHEMVQLTIDDIEDLGSAVLIKIPDTTTKRQRTFIITSEFYKIFKKYADLRPPGINERRFFLNYRNKKCTRQPIGIHKVGSTPKQIASYLGLKDPQLYGGHCYRRSSSTSSMSASGNTLIYIERSFKDKIKLADTIRNSTEVEDSIDVDTEGSDFEVIRTKEETTSNSEFISPPSRNFKRKTNGGNDPCKFMKCEEPEKRDDHTIYGEYIASRLRNANQSYRATAIAKHQIENILFKLEMGAFHNQSSNYNQNIRNSPVPSPSAYSFNSPAVSPASSLSLKLSPNSATDDSRSIQTNEAPYITDLGEDLVLP